MNGRAIIADWGRRPLGVRARVGLAFFLCLVPAWLFADLLSYYRLETDGLFDDDGLFIAASRTWSRTCENLFVPHNSHVVPAWRILTWGLLALAGRLANMPDVLAMASYGILVATMLLLGRFLAQETGRESVGVVAMVCLGTTSVLTSAATWYAASQTLWAGFGVLAMLWYLQGWRRWGRRWRLAMAALAAVAAGGFWTVGLVAGLVGAAYLGADGRRRCRVAALVPLAAALLAMGASFGMARQRFLSSQSFQGPTAIDPIRGLLHTLQAVPERLIVGGFGLSAETTLTQATILMLGLALAWAWSCRRRGRATPLEVAGATLLLISSFVEWSFRGYLPFLSLRGLVPWYDTIPYLGLVLFASGWWAGTYAAAVATRPTPLTRQAAVGAVVLQAALAGLHEPRVTSHFLASVAQPTATELKAFPIRSLQRLRAIVLASQRAQLQRRYLGRLDRAEAEAKRLGIGREAIIRTLGHQLWSAPPPVYDADLLALPWYGTEADPDRIRQALSTWMATETEPRPPWLNPLEPWPPPRNVENERDGRAGDRDLGAGRSGNHPLK